MSDVHLTHQPAIPLLHDFLLGTAARLPDKEALTCKQDRVTYRELDQRSNALAHALVQRGVKRGDRVIVFADNTVETAVSFWAVLKANAVVSVVNPLTKADKLTYLLNDCRATAMITDAHLGNVFLPAVARSPHLASVIVSGPVKTETLAALPGGAETASAMVASVIETLSAS